MIMLHTSDWHLGRSLLGRRRDEEFASFLNWLIAQLESRKVDILLVAGDVFDTVNPGHKAQEIYYGFLVRVASTGCRHVVITSGNHDSPAFLEAPRSLLKMLRVHVIGVSSELMEEEVLLLDNAHGEPSALILAVPFLRDRDLRDLEGGESFAEKDQKMREAVKVHYHGLFEIANKRRHELGFPHLPIVAMGHLFTVGGLTVEGDGVREIQVGSLEGLPPDTFPEDLDYLALGHLHVPQVLAGREYMRYSGSPIPMGFGEAGQKKSVCLLHFLPQSSKPRIELLPIPSWQDLAVVQGNWEKIESRLGELVLEARSNCKSLWVEVRYDGQELRPLLVQECQSLVAESSVEIFRIQNLHQAQISRSGLKSVDQNLEEMSPNEVFQSLLESRNIPQHQWTQLQNTFVEALNSLEVGTHEN